MLAALEEGADAIKLFPASAWSPVSLTALLAALPQLPIVPTGGATTSSAAAWTEARAVAVGLGASITAGGQKQPASVSPS